MQRSATYRLTLRISDLEALLERSVHLQMHYVMGLLSRTLRFGVDSSELTYLTYGYSLNGHVRNIGSGWADTPNVFGGMHLP